MGIIGYGEKISVLLNILSDISSIPLLKIPQILAVVFPKPKNTKSLHKLLEKNMLQRFCHEHCRVPENIKPPLKNVS